MKKKPILELQYAALAAIGFTADAKGRVWCGSPKKTDGPCTTVCFSPENRRMRGKKAVTQLYPMVSSRAIADTNRLLYFKLLQPKKHSPNAPRLWDSEEHCLDEHGKVSIRPIEPTQQWPFHGRPSHDFMMVEDIFVRLKNRPITRDSREQVEWTKQDFADMIEFAICNLDPSPIIRLEKCVEVLKKMEDARPELEKQSLRRNAVMEALQALCTECRVPPTKQALRDKAGLKVEGGRLGTKKEMDDKQFTREFINPLGLHWLPEAYSKRG